MNMKIAGEIVRQLRIERGWTQEHLAAISQTSVKTIQRVESTGLCGLETRSALAAVFQVDLKQLDGTARIEQAKGKGDDDETMFLHRLTTGTEVVAVFDGCYWYRTSHEDPRSREDVEIIADAVQSIVDWSEIWGDIDSGSKIKAAFELGELLKDLEMRGMWVFGLRTKATFNAPHRDGTVEKIQGSMCNLHVAYRDSERVIVLGPEQG